jgi:diadenosine tetraphosphate (Ap4A) HIT family hydrolase
MRGVALFVASACAWAQTPCPCDVTKPETLSARQCSLTKVTEEQPPDIRVFFLPDANPKKPNRLLALPRQQSPGLQRIADLTPENRLELWTKAIEKAKEKWGDRWGIAYNGDNVRTQCHVHIHIGRLIDGVEAGVNGKLHVHTGEQICETVLLR